MKVIAMYLPQFHRVKENDAWWGKGFTEWMSVRSAERLFPGHEQPHVPLHDNYYDLLQPETMRWQADLMKQYGVDGMCFYHYYFKDGRKILEKPAENLLRWKNIDMPFCFSWANESWVRSWSRLFKREGNLWTAKFERQGADETDDGVLLAQEYGGESAWRAHYAYLSPFFHDARYICYEGRPVFVIYKPDNIPCLKEMVDCWQELSKEDGFPGLYVIGTNVRRAREKGLSNSMLQEPQDTLARWYSQNNFKNADHVMKSIPYDEIWQRIIDKPVEPGQCLGGFSGYDDSPRHGHGAVVIKGRNPEIFGRMMYELLAKAEQNHAPFLFLNAWNEWGEGMYLEPDEAYGYQFLEALHEAKERLAHRGLKVKPVMSERTMRALQAENSVLQANCDRYRGYWQVMDQWLMLLESGKSIVNWLRVHGYAQVAVYGYGMLGKHLVRQMEQEQLPPVYLIDQQPEKDSGSLPLMTLEDELPAADLVIVTVQYDFPAIQQKLKEKVAAEIRPLDWLIDEVLK
ncbi:glycosyltransferase WbsX family protein [Selenomonas bovis]|uniref:glycosyltransferase WbsX family protein n=1 Tax=Selenomonas bovis TaxID=416586 RepID=UPI003D00DAD2